MITTPVQLQSMADKVGRNFECYSERMTEASQPIVYEFAKPSLEEIGEAVDRIKALRHGPDLRVELAFSEPIWVYLSSRRSEQRKTLRAVLYRSADGRPCYRIHGKSGYAFEEIDYNMLTKITVRKD